MWVLSALTSYQICFAYAQSVDFLLSKHSNIHISFQRLHYPVNLQNYLVLSKKSLRNSHASSKKTSTSSRRMEVKMGRRNRIQTNRPTKYISSRIKCKMKEFIKLWKQKANQIRLEVLLKLSNKCKLDALESILSVNLRLSRNTLIKQANRLIQISSNMLQKRF